MNNKILTLGLLSLAFEVSGCKNTSRQALFCCKMSDFLFIESIVIPDNTVLTDCFLCDSETDEVKYIN